MKIKYEDNEGGVCLTPCPNGKTHKVGSYACELDCKHYVSHDDDAKTLECNYEK